MILYTLRNTYFVNADVGREVHVLYWNAFYGKQQLNCNYVFVKALRVGGPSIAED